MNHPVKQVVNQPITRIEFKHLREYWRSPRNSLIGPKAPTLYHSFREVVSPGSLAILLATILTLISVFNRTAFVLLLTEVAFLTLLYFRTKAIAKSLEMRRILPQKTLREMDTLDVVVELENTSDFALQNITLEDTCEASKSMSANLVPGPVEPHSRVRLKYKKICDGGMGKKRIGPLIARVSDPLGVFEWRVISEPTIEIEIYPRVDVIPELKVRPSVESTQYGNYEVSSRGLSVNFSGVRSYERGDPLKHIAWKLSTKGRGLLVKEFEKSVSCHVNIVLNLESRWQLGRDSTSTWESAKDVTLSVIQQNLSLGNTVSFFSNDTLVEPAGGNDHFHFLAKRIAALKTSEDSEPRCLLDKYFDFFLRGSNVLYITPFNLGEVKESVPSLKRLRAEGFNVVVIFIDTNSYWSEFVSSISSGLLIGSKLIEGLPETTRTLELAGVASYVVRNKMKLKDLTRTRGETTALKNEGARQ